MRSPSTVTAAEVLAELQNRHTPHMNGNAPSWVFFTELRVGTGFGPGAEQRIDAWAFHCWPSRREAVAYEVKVSRSDFLAEMNNPAKRKAALLYSNRFYFVTPVGLVRADELPPEAGLIEVDDVGSRVVVEAPWRDPYPPSWAFVGAIARRAIKP